MPAFVISHVRPDLRNSSPSLKRGGSPFRPEHACFTVIAEIPQRSAASAVVITSSMIFIF